MEFKSAENPIDGASITRQVVANLFYGWGYNFYRHENQLRADDLLIRSRLSDLLGECRAHLHALELDYRREHLPAPSREKPFPDPSAVAKAHALQQVQQDIESLETTIRTAAVPEMDRVHQRHRNEGETLTQLTSIDGDMVYAVVTLRDAISKISDASIAADEVAALLKTSDIRPLWTRREQTLSVLRE